MSPYLKFKYELLDINLSFRKYDKKNHLNTLIGTLIVHSEKAHGK